MATEQVARLKFQIDAENDANAAFKQAEGGLSGLVKQFSLTKIAAGLSAVAIASFAKNLVTDAIGAAKGFQNSMANISTVVDTSKESIKDMGDQVLKMARNLPQSAGELADALYDIRGAGIAASGQFETLQASAKLAVAGLGSTKDAANLLTSAINAFQLDAKDANRVGDIFFKTVNFGKTTVAELAQGFGQVAPVAKQLGVSLEELQAATAALTTTGVATSVAQTQIRSAMASLIKPTKEASEIFTKLHVKTFSELIDKSGGLVAAFEKMREVTKGNDEQFAKALGSVEGLGAALSLTGANSQTFKNTLQEMKGGAEQLDEAFKKQTSTFDAQSQILKNNLNVALIKLGSSILPQINNAMTNFVIPAMNAFGQWIDDHQEGIETFFNVVGKLLTYLGKTLEFLLNMLGKVSDAASKFVDTFKSDIENIVGVKKLNLENVPSSAFVAARASNPLSNPLLGGKSSVVNMTFNGDVIDRQSFMSQIQSTMNRQSSVVQVAGAR